MAKVKTNPVLEQIRGKVGDLVFKRYNHEVIMARAPETSGKPPTPNQTAHREQFRLAVVYGKAALADPDTKALYEAKSKTEGVPVFALTVADFLHAPAVDEIDLSQYTGKTGDTIRINASDDFEVAGVTVAIHDSTGTVLEQGAAVAGSDGAWNYTATTNLPTGQTVSIDVTAADRPGNKTTKSQTVG